MKLFDVSWQRLSGLAFVTLCLTLSLTACSNRPTARPDVAPGEVARVATFVPRPAECANAEQLVLMRGSNAEQTIEAQNALIARLRKLIEACAKAEPRSP